MVRYVLEHILNSIVASYRHDLFEKRIFYSLHMTYIYDTSNVLILNKVMEKTTYSEK